MPAGRRGAGRTRCIAFAPAATDHAGFQRRFDTGRGQLALRDQQRARYISEQLNKAIVLVGDAADEELLLEENIEDTDVFCAVTNDDEANILSSMLAKRLGARKVMALINRPAYVNLVQREAIDIAISPQQATIGTLLGLLIAFPLSFLAAFYPES